MSFGTSSRPVESNCHALESLEMAHFNVADLPTQFTVWFVVIWVLIFRNALFKFNFLLYFTKIVTIPVVC